VPRKRPGVGLDTTHRMARAIPLQLCKHRMACANAASIPLNGVAQANLQFKRSCASGPVSASTQRTGWLAPFRFNYANTGWLAPIPLQFRQYA